MSKKNSEMEQLARQLYQSHKRQLDLLTSHRSESAFQLSVHRLFGGSPTQEKTVRLGKNELKYSNHTKTNLSFLPTAWQEELEKVRGTWPGCEKWWAGYPFIAWVEIKTSDDGTTGYLKLNAEVGPISNHKARKGIIKAIAAAATAAGLGRIRFPEGASDKGRLYSRFLQEGSVALNDIRNAEEIENKLVQLLAGFEPEFELVASIIPQFLSLSGASEAER